LDVHRRHRGLPSGLAPSRAPAGSFASGAPGVTEASERVAGRLSGVTTRRCMASPGPEVAGGARTGHILSTADLEADSGGGHHRRRCPKRATYASISTRGPLAAPR